MIKISRIGSRLARFENAGVIHKLAKLSESGGVRQRSGDLVPQAPLMSSHRGTDVATTDNSETKAHGEASAVHTT